MAWTFPRAVGRRNYPSLVHLCSRDNRASSGVYLLVRWIAGMAWLKRTLPREISPMRSLHVQTICTLELTFACWRHAALISEDFRVLLAWRDGTDGSNWCTARWGMVLWSKKSKRRLLVTGLIMPATRGTSKSSLFFPGRGRLPTILLKSMRVKKKAYCFICLLITVCNFILDDIFCSRENHKFAIIFHALWQLDFIICTRCSFNKQTAKFKQDFALRHRVAGVPDFWGSGRFGGRVVKCRLCSVDV